MPEINYIWFKNALNELSNQASTGTDGLQNYVYKYRGHKFILFLVKIFTQSLEETYVPLCIRRL